MAPRTPCMQTMEETETDEDYVRYDQRRQDDRKKRREKEARRLSLKSGLSARKEEG